MSLRVIDSHTGGEPTRTICEGLPTLGGSVSDRLEALRESHDWIRTSLCLEPRGSEIAIGAAIFPPSDPDCLADVVFFNNVGYLGMCGHGTIGVLASLVWLGQIEPGFHKLNTVAGVVTAHVHDRHRVSFENVRSYRLVKDRSLEVSGFGQVSGDIAYGGNWFFLVREPQLPVDVTQIDELMRFTTSLVDALWDQGVTGENGARIDHVEVFGPSLKGADSKNFVLCPGKQYDRSPCGTGTSAKLACLYSDGRLKEGHFWRQESIIGSEFDGSVAVREGQIFPTISGTAYVVADSRIVTEKEDPFGHGIVL